MCRTPLVLSIALALAPAFAAGKKPVTLEAVASAPAVLPGFETVYWSPEGKRLAWIEERVVWLYEVASGRRTRLAGLAEMEARAAKYEEPAAFGWKNRNVAERALEWSPSGDRLLAAAGGDLFLVEAATGNWEPLTTTAVAEQDARFSPDGRRVSFRRGHDLYTLEVGGRREARLTHDGSPTRLNAELDWVYPEELNLGTAHWWSPDATRIAYLQFDVSREWIYPHADLLKNPPLAEPQRYPKAGSPNAVVRLGVVDAAGGETRWIDWGPPDALIARVAWSPDSRALYVQRFNRVQNRLELLRADAASGEVRVVLREEDPYWINVDDVFRFIGDGRFLWGSERDGFRHLYLYTAEGKLIRQLTRGQWEVTAVAGVDERAGEVYYLSTEAGPLERQLYRVDLRGRRERLSKPRGTHGVSMAPTCDYYLDAATSLEAPPRRTLHARDGREAGLWREAPQEYEILPTEIVQVQAGDGTLLYGRLIRPKGFESGKRYPVVVMVYGGPHAQNVRDVWPGVSWEQALAHRGFVVWQLDNRGTSGRGHAFESQVFRNLGELELADQREGIRRLLAMGFADPERLGIYGWSYGGYMTLYALTHAPDLFRAGVAGAPVVDWRLYDTIYTERYMGLPDVNAEGYRRSAPHHRAAAVKARLLLVHNLEDDNVHFQNAIHMADALQRNGKLFEMMVYSQKTHGVTAPLRRHLLETATDFLERHLR